MSNVSSTSGQVSVQANHYSIDVHGAGDDWNTVSLGGQERSLRTAEDVALLLADIEHGLIDGLSGVNVERNGHRLTVNGQTYDLERAADTARFAADLRDGRLDGATVGSEELYVDRRNASDALVVGGERWNVNSEKDAQKLLHALLDGTGGAPGFSASEDARWVHGSKVLTAGGKRYDLADAGARRDLALDLADGVLDGQSPGGVAVDPSAVGQGQAVATSSSSALDANGYPAVDPSHEDYAKAWTTWLSTHSYEDFKKAMDSGAIKDTTKLFADHAFNMSVKDKGEASSRAWEMLSYIRRNEQQIFDHISRGFV